MKIKPFKALRPGRDKAHLVATRPFYCYSKSVLKAKLKSNPYSFLQIINPNYDLLEKETSEDEQTKRLNLVKSKYAEYIEKGVLLRDPERTLYVYRQSSAKHIYTGIITSSSIEEYMNDAIKKHEATLTSREELFTNYLDVIGYNAEPVLLCHEHNQNLEDKLNKICSQRPEYDFTTTDEVKHEMWLMTPSETEETVALFEKIDVAYIADGHHRSASSARLRNQRVQNGNQLKNDNFFLSFLMDETQLSIYEYNRLIKTNTEFDRETFFNGLNKQFDVVLLKKYRKPFKEHEIVMYFDSRWYSLTCHDNIIDHDHPVKSLDAEILTTSVLTPLLGINDLKTDTNVGFISGLESSKSLLKKMNKKGYNLAFILFPVSINQIKEVADNKMIMPPKSTWIEPKIRSGLTIYSINE